MIKPFTVGLCLMFLIIGKINVIVCQYSRLNTSGCVFPFNYNGETYNDCTDSGRKYPWCSLTENFRGVWKYCHDMTKTDWKCTSECNNDDYPTCMATSGLKMFCLDLSKNPVASCSDEYKKISPIHTACLPPQIYVAKRGVSDKEKEIIVNLHNQWRRSADVPAAAMQKLYWDDNLAYVAQKHADRCSFAHDDMNLRTMPGILRETGQNIVMVTNNRKYDWHFAFNEMFKGELKRWEYGRGIKPAFQGKNALHYTQIMLEQLSKVGCGYSECVYADRLERLFVCNYNYMQTFDESISPYQAGEFCEGCPDNCDNKLCDCGGKECVNGKVDVSNCNCICDNFFTGPDCLTEVVPEKNEMGCVFPFLFENKLHYQCITEDNGDSWCSTSKVYGENFDEAEGPSKFCNEQTAEKRSWKKRSWKKRKGPNLEFSSETDLPETFKSKDKTPEPIQAKRDESNDSFFDSLAKLIHDLKRREKKFSKKSI